MKHTPLFDEHVKLGARMAPFGGWDMPIQYAGILEEHHHTRRSASLFDTCHMGQFIIRGPDTAVNLDRLITCAAGTLTAGRCRYGFLLNDSGGILDDLIIYRVDNDRFMMVVNAATCTHDAEWIGGRLQGTTLFEDVSPITAKLDLQGPLALDVLQPLCGAELGVLPYFGFVHTTVCDRDALVSRTGYTGEYGFELYVATDCAVEIWRRLLEDERVEPAGLGARDTLRLEAGLPLYGHELSTGRTPVATPLRFAVDTSKDFIGKPAVVRDEERPTADYLVGLALDGRRSARAGNKVYAGKKCVGAVTSGSFAPSLGYAIALAYVARAHIEPGTQLEIDTGRGRLAARVVELPFYREGTARRKTR